MSVCAFEIDTLGLVPGRDVPGSTALVGDERAGEGARDGGDKGCVVGDGAEAVTEVLSTGVGGAAAAVEGFEGFEGFEVGDGVGVGVGVGEDEVVLV